MRDRFNKLYMIIIKGDNLKIQPRLKVEAIKTHVPVLTIQNIIEKGRTY